MMDMRYKSQLASRIYLVHLKKQFWETDRIDLKNLTSKPDHILFVTQKIMLRYVLSGVVSSAKLFIMNNRR